MKAMILAAGLGTRLKPLTEKTPKALILVAGRPLILYGLLLLKKFGITEVLINLHHLGALIEKEVGDGRSIGTRISYSWEEEILGTGGGIKKAESFFGGENFFALNSDILIDADLETFLKFHRKRKGIASMALKKRPTQSSYSPIWLGRGDRISEIGDASGFARAGRLEEAYLYTGLQILGPRFLEYLRVPSCVIRGGYHPALQAHEKVLGWIYEGYWNDLGTFERHRQAEQDLSSGRVQLSYLR